MLKGETEGAFEAMQAWKALAAKRKGDLYARIMSTADTRARREWQAQSIQRLAIEAAERRATEAKAKAELAKQAMEGQGLNDVERNEYLRKQAVA